MRREGFGESGFSPYMSYKDAYGVGPGTEVLRSENTAIAST